MAKLTRTTINLPEDTLKAGKVYAAQNNTSLSKLLTELLDNKINTPKTKKMKKDPMKSLGTLSVGIKEPYKKRGELYRDILK